MLTHEYGTYVAGWPCEGEGKGSDWQGFVDLVRSVFVRVATKPVPGRRLLPGASLLKDTPPGGGCLLGLKPWSVVTGRLKCLATPY